MTKATQPSEKLNGDFKGPLKLKIKTLSSSKLLMGIAISQLCSHAKILMHGVSLDACVNFINFMACQNMSTLTGPHPLFIKKFTVFF